MFNWVLSTSLITTSPSFLPKNLHSIFINILPLLTFHWFSNKHSRKKVQVNTKISKCPYLYRMYFTKYFQYVTERNLFSFELKSNCATKFTTLHKNIPRNVQRNAQFVTHNNIYWKIDFPICFGFVKEANYKVYILNWLFKLLEDRYH